MVAQSFSLIMHLSVGPALVLTGLSASAHLLSLPLLAKIDIIGLALSPLNHLHVLCLLILPSSLFCLRAQCDRPFSGNFLGGLLTTLTFKLMLALFAGFPQYFVYNVIYGTFEVLPVVCFCFGCPWFALSFSLGRFSYAHSAKALTPSLTQWLGREFRRQFNDYNGGIFRYPPKQGWFPVSHEWPTKTRRITE